MSDSAPVVPRVLIVDDDPDVRLALRILLREAGLASMDVESPTAALAAIAQDEFTCAVVDLNYTTDTTSGHEGLALVERLRNEVPELPIVVMTAWASIDMAVKAMRLGASDFVEKPWNNRRMLHVVQSQMAVTALRAENRKLRAQTALSRQSADVMRVCESSAMRHAVTLMSRIARGEGHVLILGENGTGKSLAAREIHAMSPRANQALIRVDMGILSESRFDDEMFGQAGRDAGPGRFEMADGGSMIMEEVVNIPPSHQVKLLRVVEEGEFERPGSARTRRVDVRIISTTNADVEAAIRGNRFRRDLLYRLNATQLQLPALRDRVDDIVPLARHFLLRECRKRARGAMTFTPSAERALRSYPWPGNVRELEHVIERVVLFAVRDDIYAEALGLEKSVAPHAFPERLTLPEAEEMLIRQALDRYGNNLQRAADALGISRQSLYRRIDKHRARGTFEPTH
jgi:DNA-binding NtrC family response regulator